MGERGQQAQELHQVRQVFQAHLALGVHHELNQDLIHVGFLRKK